MTCSKKPPYAELCASMEDELKRLRAATTWQPIETAPKDGTPFIGERQVTISCSLLPLLQRCNGAARVVAQAPNVSGDAATLGSALHQAVFAILDGTPFGDAVADAELRYTVDLDADRVTALVEAVAGEQDEALTYVSEQRLDADGLPGGTADRLGFNEKEGVVHVIDLKTGWVPVDRAERNLQIIGYACLAAELYPKADIFYVSIVQPPSRPSKATFFRDEIERVAAQLRDFIAHCEGDRASLAPGDHCAKCSGRMHCPAMKNAVLAVVRESNEVSINLADQPDDKIALAWYWMKTTSTAMADMERALMAEIKSRRRDLPLHDGRVVKVKQKTRSSIDVQAAAATLDHLLGPDWTSSIAKVSVSMSDVTREARRRTEAAADAAGQTLERGWIAEQEREIRRELEAAGAFKTVETESVVIE